jgi:hypothetical protein
MSLFRVIGVIQKALNYYLSFSNGKQGKFIPMDEFFLCSRAREGVNYFVFEKLWASAYKIEYFIVSIYR